MSQALVIPIPGFLWIWRARAAALACLLIGALCGCGDRPDAGSSLPVAVPAVTPVSSPVPVVSPATAAGGGGAANAAEALAVANIENLTHPPISTFERRCAGCHGPQGGFHTAKVAALTSEALAVRVIQMMRGNARLKPSPPDERAMIAYHDSIARLGTEGALFVVVTNGASFLAGQDPTLHGEITPGARLVRLTETGEEPVAVTGPSWTVSGLTEKSVRLKATLGEQTALLNFPERAWSVLEP